MRLPLLSLRWLLGGALAIGALHAGEPTPALVTEKELAAIRAEVAAYRKKLGDQAGVSEVADKFIAIPQAGKWLTAAEAQPAFARLSGKLEQIRWWKIGLDPAKLEHALREPAAVVSGCVHAVRAGLDGAPRSLAYAREAGDFLRWAQTQGGTGVFPFPAVRGVSRDKAFVAAGRFLERAERDGRLAEAVHQGWAIDDLGDGGLQFDNGEAGVAMFELSEATHDEACLKSARQAADWAAARPLARNWNYNSFSVYLLAEAFRVTGERRYLDAALRKALLGVIPGQLTDGPRAGRWVDAHNARPAYHYIMLRALALLASVTPKDEPARAEVVRALALGLKTRNTEILGPGAANKDKAVEALVLVNRLFADDAAFLRETRSAEALDALARLVSEQFRRGTAPLGPREWGLFLEYVVWQEKTSAKTNPSPPAPRPHP
ncbi:MAG: hypothetical protein NTV51_14505 [Verrucomicrobia bacterium]|nr:hypothetical protein [Verrucomicrobiota bacterium]